MRPEAQEAQVEQAPAEQIVRHCYKFAGFEQLPEVYEQACRRRDTSPVQFGYVVGMKFPPPAAQAWTIDMEATRRNRDLDGHVPHAKRQGHPPHNPAGRPAHHSISWGNGEGRVDEVEMRDRITGETDSSVGGPPGMGREGAVGVSVGDASSTEVAGGHARDDASG